jgi:DNA-binding IclR family transcriptional regulator
VPCVSPDGQVSRLGSEMLRALTKGPQSPLDVAAKLGLPLFRTRSGLRELHEAGYATLDGDFYSLSPAGATALDKPR